MNLLNEFEFKGFNVVSTTPTILCTTFEYNNGAIEIENVPKICTCNKYINLVYHHFREYVMQKKIVIKPIDTSLQMTDFYKTVMLKTIFTSLHRNTKFLTLCSRCHKERECTNMRHINMPVFTPNNIYQSLC